MSGAKTFLAKKTGGYESSGAYSIEFKTKTEKPQSLGEYFFFCGLTRLEQLYTYNISTKATYGGASIVDYGNGLNYITLSTDIHTQHTGKPIRNPEDTTEAFVGFFDNFNPIQKSGYLDFIDLMWIFINSRVPDKFFDRATGHFTDPDGLYSTIKSSFTGVKGVSTFVSNAPYPSANTIVKNAWKKNMKYFSMDNVDMFFHDYDRDVHQQVSIDGQNGFNVSISNDRPLVWTVTIKLIGIKDIAGRFKQVRPPLPDARALLNNAYFELNNNLNELSSLFKYAESTVLAFKDVKKYKDLLSKDIESFKTSNKRRIENIKSLTKKTKDKNKYLKDLILLFQTGFSEQPVITNFPNINIVDNVFTQPTADFSNIAIISTINEIDNINTALSKIDTAMILELNAINIETTTTSIKVVPGDTLPSIANLYYNDPSAIDNIILKNNLTNASVTPGIDLFVDSVTTNQFGNNGIITEFKDITSIPSDLLQPTISEYLLGSDLTNTFETNANSDLGVIVGEFSLEETIIDMLTLEENAVPLHPDFELTIISELTPIEFLNYKIPYQIIEKIRQEPGVSDVDITSITIEDTAVKLKIIVQSIVGTILEFDVNKVFNTYRKIV